MGTEPAIRPPLDELPHRAEGEDAHSADDAGPDASPREGHPLGRRRGAQPHEDLVHDGRAEKGDHQVGRPVSQAEPAAHAKPRADRLDGQGQRQENIEDGRDAGQAGGDGGRQH